VTPDHLVSADDATLLRAVGRGDEQALAHL
jgi:hypothetical protein